MEITATTMLYDFCYMGILLFIAQLLRSNIKFFQNFYIPASLIAGFAGLLLGEQFLGIIEFSSQASSYAYLLVCVLFAGIFLGKSGSTGNQLESIKKIGNTFFLNMSAEFVCFGAALFFGGALIIALFPEVFPEISLLLPAGFMGGHGYASSIGTALNTLLGRDDGVIIGQTFATLGLLTGLFGGIFAINLATRKKATRFITEAKSLPQECRTGLIPQDARPSMGKEPIHPMSMDPLAWHVAIILMATGFGYWFYDWYKQFDSMAQIEVPVMCLTMIAGVIIQTILNKVGYGHYIEKPVVDRIGSGLTDFLVAFGVATIKISVVLEFLSPILILCAIGIAWPFIFVFFVGRRGFRNFWFERSIFVFGYITGVVAIGVTLLRIVDPEMKSGTLDDFGSAYTVQSVVEVVLVSLVPTFAVLYGTIQTGAVLLAIGIGLIVANRVIYGINKSPMSQPRPGEAQVTNR